MSTFKFSPDLFLGVQELNRMFKFLKDRSMFMFLVDMFSPGLIKKSDNTIGNNFLVTTGSNPGTFQIGYQSYAVDLNGNIISQPPKDLMSVPDDSAYYWVKASYIADDIEVGVASIDAGGNLVGTGTEFLSVLRGGKYGTKIRFKSSSLNMQEYEVLDVIDNSNAVLNGDFTAESDLQYSVVGTFTPGKVVLEADKYPFQYDRCLLTLVPEIVGDTPPPKDDNLEFYIVRIVNTGGTVTIHDKRTEFYSTRVENI